MWSFRFIFTNTMRIIAGEHKGKHITPSRKLPVRPTTDRAKEGIFNILNNRYLFQGKSVLDLFSGTGNIAFEFGSRGCQSITSVDKDIRCIKHIKSFKESLELKIKTSQSDCYKYIEDCEQQYDFIFADPPYKYHKYEELKDLIITKNIIKKGGCLIIEHDKNTTFKDPHVELRKYSNVYFSIFSF